MFVEDNRLKDEFILSTMNDLVPENHLVRKIAKWVDFSFIYDLTKPFYSDIGRPAIDPVVLFKIPIIKSLFGISSIRRTCEEINVNVAYRWFINLPFSKKVPDHSTYSKNYTKRFYNTDIYQEIFINVLNQIIEHNLIDFTNINIDSTHIKASANKRKFIEKIVEKEKSVFEDEMLEFINKNRDDNNDKPLPPTTKKTTKRSKESTTDKDAGWLNKGEKEKNFSYNAHTACDKHGFIIRSVLKPSNIHDSKVFKEVYEPLLSNLLPLSTISMDNAYNSGPLIKSVCDNKHLPLLPYKRPMGNKNYELFRKLKYDELLDVYIDNDGLEYSFKSINRQGYKIYRNKFKKEIRISIYKPYFDYSKNLRKSEYGKEIYSRRKETIERCFADFKERHFGRYTHYRGLKKVSDHTLLIFASMNMKKMANLLSRTASYIALFNEYITNIMKKRHFFQVSH